MSKQSNKPFYVDVGTSVVAIRCASNHDILWRCDHVWNGKGAIEEAERICARMNDEAAPTITGNFAALREVVELVSNMNVDGYWNGSASICELVGKAKAALAKPARNCDRFRGPLAYYESLDVYIKEEERPVAEDGKGDPPLSYEDALERMNKYRQWLFALAATETKGEKQ